MFSSYWCAGFIYSKIRYCYYYYNMHATLNIKICLAAVADPGSVEKSFLWLVSIFPNVIMPPSEFWGTSSDGYVDGLISTIFNLFIAFELCASTQCTIKNLNTIKRHYKKNSRKNSHLICLSLTSCPMACAWAIIPSMSCPFGALSNMSCLIFTSSSALDLSNERTLSR